MKTRPYLRAAAAAALAAALSLAGAAPARAQDAGEHAHAPASAPAQAGAPSPADVRFMSSMIGHHAQAIVMAGWAASHGASPQVRTLAARIINAQRDEIATMQRWLRDHGQPVPEVHDMPMPMDGMPGMEHGELMPGMLTPEQMARLDAARGAEFDRLFLTFMMQHHRGAVSMVRQLFASYGAAQDETVFKFASDVNVDQTTEIARMQRMLAALVFGDNDAP